MSAYALKDAFISECEQYRYTLVRDWNKAGDIRPRVRFVMLNPSKADASVDDPTIRKCVGFANRNGYGGIVVVNVFALRATDPRSLVGYHGDRIGPQNNEWLTAELRDADVILGWGAWGSHSLLRDDVVRFKTMLRYRKPRRVRCLGLTKEGEPRHPLMLAYTTPLEDFYAFHS